MSITEKILLVELLLIDIRGNWGWENDHGICSRAVKARTLCEELASELADERFMVLADRCSDYIADYFEDGDGRYFREAFPHGYENLDNMHDLEYTFADKSDEFKVVVDDYLTHPECRFDDWDARFDD